MAIHRFTPFFLSFLNLRRLRADSHATHVRSKSTLPKTPGRRHIRVFTLSSNECVSVNNTFLAAYVKNIRLHKKVCLKRQCWLLF